MDVEMKDSEKAVKYFASRVMRRLAALGQSSLKEDVTQELWVAWCIAKGSFDPNGGASFRTYLENGMRLHINRYIEKHVERRISEVFALSLGASFGYNGNDEGEGALQSVIPSGDPALDERIIAESVWSHRVKKLSAKSRQFVDFLHRQPVELLSEVKKISERARHSKSLGISAPHSTRITSAIVFQLMGVSGGERQAILEEVRLFGQKMCEVDHA
ncbi:MAG: sigma factor [Undibacterium sp.]